MLQKRVESIVSQLTSAEDRELLHRLLVLAEQARSHIEVGYGSYALLKAVQEAYAPEVINLHQWTK